MNNNKPSFWHGAWKNGMIGFFVAVITFLFIVGYHWGDVVRAQCDLQTAMIKENALEVRLSADEARIGVIENDIGWIKSALKDIERKLGIQPTPPMPGGSQ